MFKIRNLTVLGQKRPLGIDVSPEFSYQTTENQLSRRIELFENNSLVWDSGVVFDDETANIKYTGKALKSKTFYSWRVTATGEDGTDTKDSELLTGIWEWDGKWITDSLTPYFTGSNEFAHHAASYFTKEFELASEVKRAVLYISGLGYFDARINGVPVTDTFLNPRFTAYDKRVMYCTFLVESLKKGVNKIDITLGNGFYNSGVIDVWEFHNAPWKDNPKLILQLEVFLADGTKQTIVSDETFLCYDGPIVYNELRSGEIVDFRITPSHFRTVEIARPPGGKMFSQYHNGITVEESIPLTPYKESGAVSLFDVGKNIAGWAFCEIDAEKNTEIKIEYSEQPFTFTGKNTENIACYVKSCDFQTDTVISNGGKSVFRPTFCYHGFRYIRVTKSKNCVCTVTAQSVHTRVEEIGSFFCSSSRINCLQKMAVDSIKTNLYGFLTDCPHREKNPWTGDAQLSSEQLMYNLDDGGTLSQWVESFKDAMRPSGQLPGIIPTGGWGYNWGNGPAWDSAMFAVSYYCYMMKGETHTAASIYPYLVRYLEYCKEYECDGIVGFGINDWCPPKGAPVCSNRVTDTYYLWLDFKIASEFACALGKADDKKLFDSEAERIKIAFLKRFPEKGEKSQTAYGCALMLKKDENLLNGLIESIENNGNKLNFGVIGARTVGKALAENQRLDLFLQFLLDDEYPSWGFMEKNNASSTLWEHWEGDSSLDHHMFSDYSSVLYKGLAGIIPLKPGFKRFLVKPQFVKGIDAVECSHICPYGEIGVSWLRKQEKAILTVTVPPNTMATVSIGNTEKDYSFGRYTIVTEV